MTITSLVDWLIEEIRVPLDPSDPFLRRYNVEVRIPSDSHGIRALLGNGYSREQRVTQKRV